MIYACSSFAGRPIPNVFLSRGNVMETATVLVEKMNLMLFAVINRKIFWAFITFLMMRRSVYLWSLLYQNVIGSLNYYISKEIFLGFITADRQCQPTTFQCKNYQTQRYPNFYVWSKVSMYSNPLRLTPDVFSNQIYVSTNNSWSQSARKVEESLINQLSF